MLMKKIIFTLFTSAAWIASANAQCGTSVTRTWDGGGSDDNFFTAANWTGDVVPDCNDNIVFGDASFGRSGNKGCRINGSFTTSGNITINNIYSGRIAISGTGTAIKAHDFLMRGGMITATKDVGHFEFNSLTISESCMFVFSSNVGMDIKENLTLNPGFMSFGANSTVNLNSIFMTQNSQLNSPENGTVNLSGNFLKAKLSTFHHAFSTWNIIGTESQAVLASNAGTGLATTKGNLRFWNVNLNKTSTASVSSDNWELTDHTDTIIIDNRLNVIAGDIISSDSDGGFMINDTMNLIGQGGQGHFGRIFCGSSKVSDIFLNDQLSKGNITLVVLKDNSNARMNLWKGTAAEIHMPGANVDVQRGNLHFPDNVTVNIADNRYFASGPDGTLNMPATATFKMDGSKLNLRGPVVPNLSLLELTGSNPIEVSFGGNGRKPFYNILINTATENAGIQMGSNDTLEAINDFNIKAGMVTTASGNPDDDAVVYISGDLDIFADAAANAYSGGQIFVLGGSGNSTLKANALLSSGRLVIDKANASDVVSAVSTGDIAYIGAASQTNAGLFVRKGILTFEDKHTVIATRPGAQWLVVDYEGRLDAPYADTLEIRGSFNFAHSGAFRANNGTVILGNGNCSYNLNSGAVVFNNLLIDAPGSRTFNHADSVIVKGNLTLAANAQLIDGNLVLEGNLRSGNGSINMTKVIARGSHNQTFFAHSPDLIRKEGLVMDKSAGRVILSSDFNMNKLHMNNGILNSGGQVLTVFGANAISGGNANSFIEGAVNIQSNSPWAGSRYFIPVGRGNNFRPVQLHNNGWQNSFRVTYVNRDTLSTLGSAGSHGMEAISASEYWLISRTSLGNSATAVELSTNGKDINWANNDLRVARWNDLSSSWENYGPGAGAGSVSVRSTRTDFTEAFTDRLFTIGVDNILAPMPISTEGVSGQEVALVRSTDNADNQKAAQVAIDFNVFPNPVSETLNIALSGTETGRITLSDLSGKTLGVYTAGTRSINMRNFSAGIYLVTYSNGTQRITQRVIRN